MRGPRFVHVFLVLVLAAAVVVPETAGPVSAQTDPPTPTANADGSYTVPLNWELKPFGLASGVRFRLLFKTSTYTSAGHQDIEAYNRHVQAAAVNQHVPTAGRISRAHPAIKPYASLFKVVGCTATVNARDNTKTRSTDLDARVYWLGGLKLADNYADFYDGSWDYRGPYDTRNESGWTASSGDWPWTGCNANGTSHADSLGSSGSVRIGASDNRYFDSEARKSIVGNYDPISDRSITNGVSRQSRPLYGMSPVFVVADPEVPRSERGLEFRVCPGGGCDESSDEGWVVSSEPELTVHEGEQGLYQYRLKGYPQMPFNSVLVSISGTDGRFLASASFDLDRVTCYSTAQHATQYLPLQSVGVQRGPDGGVNLGAGGCPYHLGGVGWGERAQWHTVRLGAGQDSDAINHEVTFWHRTFTYHRVAGRSQYSSDYFANLEHGGRWPLRISIVDDEAASSVRPDPAGVSIEAVSRRVGEGDTAQFRVSADSSVTLPATVSVVVESYSVGNRRVGVAVASKYLKTYQVTIPSGPARSAVLDVPTDDNDWPWRNAYLIARIAPGAGYQADKTADITTVGIDNDDEFSGQYMLDEESSAEPAAMPVVEVSGGADVTEGGDTRFTFTASPAPEAPLQIVVDVGAAGDFGAVRGHHTLIMASSGQAELTLPTTDDEHDETDGSVTLTVLSSYGYEVGSQSSATVNVADNDAVETALPAGHPLVKYAALVTSFYDRITANAQHGDGPGGGWNKRFLKALGHPEYVDYPQPAVTVADAQRLFDHGGPGANTAWAGTVEAVTYANNYTPPTVVPELTIAAGAGVTEGSAASFTLSSSPAPTSPITAKVNVTALGSYGVTTGVRDVTVPASGSVTFTVDTTGDSVDEPDGSVTATVQTGTGYTVGSPSAGTVAVADDDVPAVSISPGADITEGGTASFTISASPAPASPITVNVAVAETGSFGASGAATVTVSGASTTYTVTTSGDNTDEPDGSVTATVQAGSGYTVGSPSAGTVAISDDDDPPPVDPLVKYAGLVKSFYDRITANHQHGDGASGGWNKRFLKAMRHGDYVDYPQAAATVADAQRIYDAISPGGSTAWDGTVEALTYAYAFYAARDAETDTTDPPPPPPVPVVTVSGGSGVTEGTAASFTLSASPAPSSAITVKVNVTADGSFGVTTGVRNITVSTTGTKTFTVPTIGDDIDEPDGSATATVQAGAGYTVGSPSAGTVNISDDDDPPVVVPVVSISAGAGVTEGADASFTLSASPAPASAITVKVNVTATGSFGVTTGVRNITVPTTGTKTFTVNTTGDSVDEPHGSATATVQTGTGYTVGSPSAGTVTISDDDNPPPPPPPTVPVVSISAGAGVTEGADASFTLSASPAPTSAITVKVNVTATGSFGVTTGVRNITVPTTGITTFTVATTGDNLDETDGTATATVQTGTGYTVGAPSAGTVNISDNDVPEVTVTAGVGVTEGADASFTVSASPTPHSPLAVTVEITATGDYGITTGNRTITVPTTGITTFTVATTGDNLDETDGTATATVQTGTGYTVGAPSAGTVNISDDDPAPVGNSGTLMVSAQVKKVRSSRGYLDPMVGRPGQTLVFEISTSETAQQPVTIGFTVESLQLSAYFDYCLLPANTDPEGFRCNTLPRNYNDPTGTVTIPKGGDSATVTVFIDPAAFINGWPLVDLKLTSLTGAKDFTNTIATGRVRK